MLFTDAHIARTSATMRAISSSALTALTLLLTITIAMSSARSAPASSDELAGSGDERGRGAASLQGSTAPGVPVLSAVPQSKTVELLLQLQEQPNAFNGASQPKSDSARRRLSASAASAPAPSTPTEETMPLAAALKATVLRDAATRNVENDSEARAASREGNFERSGSTGTGLGPQTRREPSESLLSNPIIRYIRENRATVVGVSLAVLAAVWLTANFSLRRSR